MISVLSKSADAVFGSSRYGTYSMSGCQAPAQTAAVDAVARAALSEAHLEVAPLLGHERPLGTVARDGVVDVRQLQLHKHLIRHPGPPTLARPLPHSWSATACMHPSQAGAAAGLLAGWLPVQFSPAGWPGQCPKAHLPKH